MILQKKYEKLKTSLLPDLSEVGNPNFSGFNENERIRISSFCLLVHAEIEHYIEEMLKEKVKDCFDNRDYTPSGTVVPSVCLKFGLSVKSNKNDGDIKVDQALSWYFKIVSENHGIKSTNLVKLFDAIGLNEDELGSEFLSETSSFGSTRGKLAHKSLEEFGEILNPVDICGQIERILEHIRRLKKLVDSLS